MEHFTEYFSVLRVSNKRKMRSAIFYFITATIALFVFYFLIKFCCGTPNVIVRWRAECACLAYSPPSSSIMYSEGCLGTNREVVLLYKRSLVGDYIPDCLMSYQPHVLGLADQRLWIQYEHVLPMIQRDDTVVVNERNYVTTIFLHSRTTKGGKAFLIITDMSIPSLGFLYTSAIHPGGLGGHPALVHQCISYNIGTSIDAAHDPFELCQNGRNRQLKVFAGQADPDDNSHIIIPFEANGIAGVIDGWLFEDGHNLVIRWQSRECQPSSGK
jgi:hypothetical protein